MLLKEIGQYLKLTLLRILRKCLSVNLCLSPLYKQIDVLTDLKCGKNTIFCYNYSKSVQLRTACM